MSLLKRAEMGLREMPSNAAWLVSRVAGSTDSVGEAAETVTSRAREAVASVTPASGSPRRRLGEALRSIDEGAALLEEARKNRSLL